MNGADSLVSAAVGAGVDLCLANPGTTEMELVKALADAPGLRPVLVLFEGVASGAADGYARISGKPAAVMLHLGPGLGNATANLHNARRGQSPVVCWIGDHATWISPHDPPLHSDVEAIARGTAKWVRTSAGAADLARDSLEAIGAARSSVPGVAALILPMDLLAADVDGGTPRDGALAQPRAKPVDQDKVRETARVLREARSPAVLLGGHATDRRGTLLGARVAEAVGGTLLYEQFPRIARREPGLPAPDRLGYLPAWARAQLAAHDVVAVFGADRPVAFFGYPGDHPELTAKGAVVVAPTCQGGDPRDTLEALAEALDALGKPRNVAQAADRRNVGGALQPETMCAVIAGELPEETVVVDEGITASLPLYSALTGAAPHDYMSCKGGSVGFALPAATGAALAGGDGRVLCYSGDGSAAYTAQALWTQAREGLNVTTVVVVNHKYAILEIELMHAGGKVEGAGKSLTSIADPGMDWTHIARGYGVDAREARDPDSFRAALKESFQTPGPMLIAAII